MTETLAQTLQRLTKHLPPPSMSYEAAERLFLSAPPSMPIIPATVTTPNALAAPQPTRAAQPQPRHDRWRQGIDRAYYSMSARTDPAQQAKLDILYASEIAGGPGYAKVRRNAVFGKADVVAYSAAAAAAIMKQARQIENGTYASRAKGKHGGCLGRAAMAVLEFMLFVQWPRSHYGLSPSIAHIARGARLSRSTVCEALKTLELHGFLKITHRRKIIQTVFGPKIVQDTNGYQLQQVAGLGAMALELAARGSESNRSTAKEIIIDFLCEKEKDCNQEKKLVGDYIECGQVQQDFGPS